MQEFKPGQRWINNAELQMGLGTVVTVDFRTIDMIFLASGERRTYAKQTAPLTRVQFVKGDTATSHEGWSLTVESVENNDGILTYTGTKEDGTPAKLEEGLLDNHLQLNSPSDRLFTAQIDKNKWYDLRYQTRFESNQLSRSSLRGLAGGRTSLIPHQLYIAHEVASRFAPRVLLADEVGLGKTIEAGMILHQQLITERAKRILIVVPESLMHQWLVEMLRRFNLFFSIFDENRCQAEEESTQQDNPFHTEQLIICTLEFLVGNPHRLQQAVNGEWDLLIVDEAHHLQWSPEQVSVEYQCIEQLSAVTKGLLLLTATPEQLGKESHFARLRLLDPARFPDYHDFLEEEKSYEPVAHAVEALLGASELDKAAMETIQATIKETDNLALLNTLEDNQSDEKSRQIARNQLVEHLLDRHGTGRVLFRNTRSAIKGFPGRKMHAYPLSMNESYSRCLQEFQSTAVTEPQLLLCPELIYQSVFSAEHPHWTEFDARVQWLADTLKKLGNEKVLVIAASADTALDLDTYLRTRTGIHAAVFHERLSIVERDRSAAFFADMEYGTQVLICSEIGSEGRNFQFAHHLILFDLPLNPDLLEQRIGRLDRIGQDQTIEIHVPYLENSAQDIMYQWYQNGLNAFEQTCPAGHNVFVQVQPALVESLHQLDDGFTDLPELIETTSQLNNNLNEALQRGRDALLEYNSCRPHVAEAITNEALQADQESGLLDYLERVFDCYGVDFEDHSQECYIARPSEHMQIGSFPGLNDEGITLTCNRDRALANEDIHFMSWDHPLVTGAIDLVLDNELGNTSVTALKCDEIKQGTMLLECMFILEPGSDKSLENSNTLPVASLRTLIDLKGKSYAQQFDHDFINWHREHIKAEIANKLIKGYTDLLRNMISMSEQTAQNMLPELLTTTYQQPRQTLTNEIDRLKALKKINPNVREEEIAFYEQQLAALESMTTNSQMRLDALRVIVTI
ncbi:MAG: RNA polymerase-associated protein RapA [Gammaproteobacteria bacterium]|nr:RNA polymerase-associated protein RapA [Gammaproteobacteria bacterium]